MSFYQSKIFNRRAKRASLIIGLCSFSSLFALLCFLLAGNSASLYLLPSQIDYKKIQGQVLSIGGIIQPGSLSKSAAESGDAIITEFVLYDPTDINQATLRIKYNGIAPALLNEGQGVIVEGGFSDINARIFESTKLFVKHDENYKPRSKIKK